MVRKSRLSLIVSFFILPQLITACAQALPNLYFSSVNPISSAFSSQPHSGIEENSFSVPQATPDPNSPYPIPVQMAQIQLSQELGVPTDLIGIDSVAEWDWQDSCLGVTAWQEKCPSKSTPGFRVILQVGAQKFEFRTDTMGEIIIRVNNSGKFQI